MPFAHDPSLPSRTPPVVALLLFLIVLILILWQPRGLSVGWWAAGGGAMALITGLVTLQDLTVVLGIVWDATLTFVALVLLTLVLDRIGFFTWAALHVVHRARQDGHRLFFLALLLGAVVACFFTNDGAALILTPILYEEVRALAFPEAALLAFVVAGGFISDVTSLPLVVSNLTNILTADFFHIGFLRYARLMVPVDVAALVTSSLLLYAYYRHSLPKRAATEELPDPSSAIRDPWLFRRALWLTLAMVVGYFISEWLRLPVSLVALASASLLLFWASRRGIDVWAVTREAPWSIVVFSLGMYLVVFGLENAGFLHFFTVLLTEAGQRGAGTAALAAGGIAAGLSAVMNNLPTVMVMALTVRHLPVGHAIQQVMALASVVGTDIGPKLTPIGSLATLLWLHVLERRGVRITWQTITKVGLILTVPVLLAALLTLVLVQTAIGLSGGS